MVTCIGATIAILDAAAWNHYYHFSELLSVTSGSRGSSSSPGGPSPSPAWPRAALKPQSSSRPAGGPTWRRGHRGAASLSAAIATTFAALTFESRARELADLRGTRNLEPEELSSLRNDRSTRNTFRTAAWLLYAGAVVTGVVGAILYWFDDPTLPTSLTFEFARQPCLRDPPIPASGRLGHGEHLGDFIVIEPTEDAQLDHAPAGRSSAGVVRAPRRTRAAHRRGLSLQPAPRGAWPPAVPAALFRAFGFGVVDEYPGHRHRGQRHEVGTIFPVGTVLADQFDEGFVHEGRCVERMVGPLGCHSPPLHRTKLVVENRKESFEHGFVAA